MTDQLPREFRLACSLVDADIATLRNIKRVHRPEDRASLTVIAWMLYNNPRRCFSYKCIADMAGKKSHSTIREMISRCQKPGQMPIGGAAKDVFDEFTRLDRQRESWATRPLDGYSVMNAYFELVSAWSVIEVKAQRDARLAKKKAEQ